MNPNQEIFESLVKRVEAWARLRSEVLGVAIVGSYARGAATVNSDIDVVLVVEDMAAYLDQQAWLSDFGETSSVERADYGLVQSLRVFYREGPEVEWGVTDRRWCAVPPDPGTASVVAGGMRIIYDPHEYIAGLRDALLPKIRTYRAEDWDSFLALDLETGAIGLSPEAETKFRATWAETLKTRFGWGPEGPTTNSSKVWVLESADGNYAGHLWLTEQSDLFSGEKKLWISTIAVAAKYRGQGLGRLLLKHARAEARARGLVHLGLSVDVGNLGARALYEQLGFTTTRLTMEVAV